MSEYLDSKPILDVVAARGGVSRILNVTENGAHSKGEFGSITKSDRHVVRWRQVIRRMSDTGKVTPWAADRTCIELLGVNPVLVYGKAWFDAIPDEGEAA